MGGQQTITVGKVVNVHGLKGVVKVYSYAESPTLFSKGRKLTATDAGGTTREIVVQWSKPGRKVLLVALEGIDNRTASEELVGCMLSIDRSTLPDLADGTFYWFELIGLSVYTTDGIYIGQVEAIMPTGSNDVYVVKNNDAETLVPALESVVMSIDLDGKTMQVDLPEGL